MKIGKIGRLPEDLQEDLNRRILAEQPETEILQWLNSLPNVQAVLALDFDAQPIRQKNLVAWKKGGFRKWLMETSIFMEAAQRALARYQTPQTRPQADQLTQRR